MVDNPTDRDADHVGAGGARVTCETPLSAAELGDLAMGRLGDPDARRLREHLTMCLPCLLRFSDLRAALAGPPPAEARAPQPPRTVADQDAHARLRTLVGEIEAEVHDAAARLRAVDTVIEPDLVNAERAGPHRAGGRVADEPRPGRRGASPLRPTDLLLERIEALTSDTTRRLRSLYEIRTLVKKVRRVRRQIRKSNISTYHKVNLRSVLADAEDALLRAIVALAPRHGG
jgi:hypothetical protein